MSGAITQTQHESLVEKVNRVEVGLATLNGRFEILAERINTTNDKLAELGTQLGKAAETAAIAAHVAQDNRKYVITTTVGTIGVFVSIVSLIIRFFIT